MVRASDDKRGATALTAAARWGRTGNAQLLLDKGAGIEVRDNHGNTAFLIAASGGGYPTADAAELLLTRGANIDARNNNGDTALILAASNGGAEDVKIVKMPLNHGADLQAKNEHGQTALDLTRKKDRPKTAALLRSAAAEPPLASGSLFKLDRKNSKAVHNGDVESIVYPASAGRGPPLTAASIWR